MNTASPGIRSLIRGGLMLLGVSVLTACGGDGSGGSSGEARLPISINEAMASLINHSADPIWVAAWRNPQNDSDWRELEHLARQLQVGATLLTIPGTGPLDDEWTANSTWVGYANDLGAAAGRALSAARSRNVQSIASAGDEIVEVCESCHIDFKPGQPTMNIYGELSPLPSDRN